MKRIIALFCFLMAVTAVWAQTESEHLTFKGVPIDGPMSSFIQSMKAKGLTYVSTQNGVAMFTGDFATQKNCTVIAIAKQQDKVSRVGVIFSGKQTWSLLSNEYFGLKDMLTGKYGEPAECIEEFQTHMKKEDIDDNMKMLYVGLDKCKYETLYITPVGQIKLWITPAAYSDGGEVMLLYLDLKNETSAMNQAMDDL